MITGEHYGDLHCNGGVYSVRRDLSCLSDKESEDPRRDRNKRTLDDRSSRFHFTDDRQKVNAQCV